MKTDSKHHSTRLYKPSYVLSNLSDVFVIITITCPWIWKPNLSLFETNLSLMFLKTHTYKKYHTLWVKSWVNLKFSNNEPERTLIAAGLIHCNLSTRVPIELCYISDFRWPRFLTVKRTTVPKCEGVKERDLFCPPIVYYAPNLLYKTSTCAWGRGGWNYAPNYNLCPVPVIQHAIK